MTNVTGAAGPSNGRRGERYVANSAFGAEFLNAVYRRNTPVRDRVEERAVILLVEIRVRASELGDRPVEPPSPDRACARASVHPHAAP